jgi:hypothetical protein
MILNGNTFKIAETYKNAVDTGGTFHIVKAEGA